MSYSTRVRISLVGGTEWEVIVKPEALRAVQGLPSGRLVTLERKTGDVQLQQVLVRPYYRRFIDGELHIFATQVIPKKEPHHGK